MYRLVFNPKVFFVVFLLSCVFLSASQTKTYGTSKYIGGNQSLLFQYVSAGPDADYIEEEGVDTVISESPLIDTQAGLLPTPLAIDETLLSPTYDLSSYDQYPMAVSMPLIFPGVTFGITKNEPIKYAVQVGDTLENVALKFGINIDTLALENKITARTILHPGDVLTVLPTTGLSHKIKSGDTLQKIANLYKVDAQKIMDFNRIASDKDLFIGETIIIPGGKAPATVVAARPATSRPPAQASGNRPPPARVSGSGMLWPTINHIITQYFSWRHTGIDIGIPIGSALYAADDGVVEKSGWNTGGYGYMVLINHGNGIKTRYGHASKLLVEAGEEVQKGDVIALSGSTGRSTGPHLHFEVIVNGVRVNPFLYVR